MRIEHSLDIAAPLDTVWSLTVDVEALPQITPTMTSVARLDDGPLGVGSQVRIDQPGQPARTWTVTTFEPGSRFEWSTRALGSTMTGVHEMHAVEGGTRNTLAVELEGPTSRVVGLLLARVLRRAIATENDGIRDAATTSSSSRPSQPVD